MTAPAAADSTAADRRRWARYLVEERAEGAVYQRLAARRSGEERAILLGLAEAERRHEKHWLDLLGGEPTRLPRAGVRSRLLGWMAGRFGSIFVLALAQSAEARSPYDAERWATPAMRADEKVHHEVVRGLAARGRRRLSGSFRAAVFGANDGLVSNLALVLGIGATGVSSGFVLFSGIAGLLAGALSMGAGEFVSVRSQRELLTATEANEDAAAAAADLDIDENELALVYRARGMDQGESLARARRIVQAAQEGVRRAATGPVAVQGGDAHEVVGNDWTAAISSFLLFASGAIVPVLPWIFGMEGTAAIVLALVLVGIALLSTGAMVGVLSGGPPLRRALRQLAIGFGAAAVTYALGLLFGVGAV
ncbi:MULTISPECIES: VIT1/CCC1 transporter family protein [Microbacterium]|uniref:VIT1/CCC1 transporter family protein n=1 Tax=Microbacterium TaxID=33882 RepID=UPI00046A7AEF|nr:MULTISPECIES: VIT1/CCC1 family protein [Microbacterium]AMG84497.1 rubrerythrin family protein [Microbacterium sp. PAMC 28756]OSO97950.1 rubrerythrin family protein [Microbacterium sp. LEMMJ01]QXE31406.1 VIT1/CCC1 transporter family protein [Microbacterium paraoxydans]